MNRPSSTTTITKIARPEEGAEDESTVGEVVGRVVIVGEAVGRVSIMGEAVGMVVAMGESRVGENVGASVLI